ncbi:MAG: hypothetical protein OXU92_00315 [Deltaproteobacteria bacterium]|nr:hypothetical protein [Deltaproteobacteria bacterium]
MLKIAFLVICIMRMAWQFSKTVFEAVFGYPQYESIYEESLFALLMLAMTIVLSWPAFPSDRLWFRNLLRCAPEGEDMGEIDEDLWIKSLKSERVVVGLFGVFMGCIVNALVFHTLGRELSGVLFWGINLAWTHLCYAWIFRGSRPPQRGGGVAPPGE